MGGAEKLISEIVPRLQEMGHQVDVLTFNGRKTPLRDKLEKAGVRIFDGDENRSPYSIKNLFKIKQLIKNYDVLHTHNTAAQFYCALLPKKKKQVFITTEHCIFNRRRGNIIFKALDRLIYRKYDTIICISEPVKDALKKQIGNSNDQLCVIPNGIDLDIFRDVKSNESIGLDWDSGHVLIQVAGFRYEKDQATTIQAMVHLPSSCHLLLVGDGPTRGEHERLAGELGLNDRVHFLGVREDVTQLLASSDIVVVSSHYEAFGLSAIEGMAAGKPVVVSNVPGLAEITSPAALLFKAGDADDLSDKIRSLINDEGMYAKIATACRLHADRYDISKMVLDYLDVYNVSLNATEK